MFGLLNRLAGRYHHRNIATNTSAMESLHPLHPANSTSSTVHDISTNKMATFTWKVGKALPQSNSMATMRHSSAKKNVQAQQHCVESSESLHLDPLCMYV